MGRGDVDRADVVWRHRPEDLSAFSRGEGPGDTVRPAGGRPAAGSPPAGVPGAAQGPAGPGGVTEGLQISARKPPGCGRRSAPRPGYLRLKHTMRDLGLVTVCEEAGCPNIFECWADGTATFMINGERCTRACGFCLVDTRHPEAARPGEPERVAEAVERMGLGFAVVTAVARDDLPDGAPAPSPPRSRPSGGGRRACRSRC